jgi:hypothetical protein
VDECAHDIHVGVAVRSMIGQRDSGGIEHLQKQIPNQAVCLFDFIEQENALPVFAKDSSQTSRAAGFVSHEQLHIVQVEEFRHVEPEHGTLTEQVTGKFQRQLRLIVGLGRGEGFLIAWHTLYFGLLLVG